MNAERDLVSWLIEFGYLRYPSPEALRRAFRVARAERGGERLNRELLAHEGRRRAREFTVSLRIVEARYNAVPSS
jgi:hypothetical protein